MSGEVRGDKQGCRRGQDVRLAGGQPNFRKSFLVGEAIANFLNKVHPFGWIWHDTAERDARLVDKLGEAVSKARVVDLLIQPRLYKGSFILRVLCEPVLRSLILQADFGPLHLATRSLHRFRPTPRVP